MEYIFGTVKILGKLTDILKTVGDTHSNLKDDQEIVRKYPDCTITDSFRVVSKYLSKTDDEGRCYDWYAITNHYRYIDYFTPQKAQLDSDIADIQTALIESDTST